MKTELQQKTGRFRPVNGIYIAAYPSSANAAPFPVQLFSQRKRSRRIRLPPLRRIIMKNDSWL